MVMNPRGRPAASAMLRPNDKQRVLDHYNRASPYYRALWGEHFHHGYWISKEIAQLQLVEQSRRDRPYPAAGKNSRCRLRLRCQQHLSLA